MALLEISIPNSADIDGKFLALIGLMADPSSILDEASALILNRMRRNFLLTTSPDGQVWPESEAARGRKKSGRGGATLYDTGTLFNSIQLFSISPNERAIATDVPYARAHNDGLGKHPVRKFMGFAEADGQLAERLVLKRFTEALES